MKKRLLAILLLTAMLCTLFPQITLFASAAASGTCGDDLSWSFDAQTGTLIISGSGEMYDYQNGTFAPWHSFCDDILSASLPDGLTGIGVLAFAECHNLKSIVIPEGVSRIGHSAFYYCTGLQKVTLPKGLQTIEAYAFANCWKLADCPLPEGLEHIGAYAFQSCALTQAVLPATVTAIDIGAFSSCEKLNTVSVPDGVTELPDEAFSYCKALTDVTLPDSMTKIGDSAFSFCRTMTKITLPASVAEIGDYAFCGCEKLLHVHCLGDLPKLGEGLLKYCTEDTEFCYLPDAEGWNNCTYHAEPLAVAETAPATCTEKGASVYVCSCGETYPAGETAALGHDFADGVCTRCGATDPNWEPPVPVDPCADYTDVDRGSWYHSAADFVIERGIMGSTKTGALTFEPSTACTRSMIVSILYRLSGSPEVTYEAKFPDVPADKWYTDAVIWAYQNGIVKGYDTGLFGTNDKITREQMAVILMTYAQYCDKDTDQTADLSVFPDGSKATWSKTYVEWAVGAGMISGKTNNGKTLLDPQGNATRAEVATILMRFCELP